MAKNKSVCLWVKDLPCIFCLLVSLILENWISGIFLVVKFQGHVFLRGWNKKLRQTPLPSCILRLPPPPPWDSNQGAGMVQWWEHSPPTSVTWVRFPNPRYMYICGLSLLLVLALLWRFFLWFSSFLPSTKTNLSKFQFDWEFRGPQVWLISRFLVYFVCCQNGLNIVSNGLKSSIFKQNCMQITKLPLVFSSCVKNLWNLRNFKVVLPPSNLGKSVIT